MDDFTAKLIGSLEDRRALTVAMLDGFKAGVFDRKPEPEDVAFFQAELVEIDAELADLRHA